MTAMLHVIVAASWLVLH